MPKKTNIPTLGLHARTGQARVLIGGRHIYLGKYGSADAEEKYRRIVAEYLTTGGVAALPSQPKPEERGLTVNELILAYWRHAESYYQKNGKPTTELSTFKIPFRVLRRLYGSTPAAEFGPLKLKAVREELMKDGNQRLGARDREKALKAQSRSVINRSIGRIRRVFAWGAENELVPGNVVHNLKAVAGLRKGRSEAREKPPVSPVAEADINAVMPHVNRQVRDMIRLQLLTGCRPGEIVALRPCDLIRGDEVWEYVPIGHKTEHHGRPRRVFFGPRAQEILAPYLRKRPSKAYCFSPLEAETERLAELHAQRKTALSCGNKPRPNANIDRQRPPGDHYTRPAYRRAIERACIKAGITPWSPNRLRHSRATDLRRRFGIEAAQTVLGHAELEVTQVYAERDFAAARKIMADVG